MAGQLIKGKIGKEDFEIQYNVNDPETFERTASAGGTTELTKIPDLWGGSGKINIAEIETDDLVVGGFTTTTNIQGDVYFHDGTEVQRLAAGTKGKALTTGGASANPSWEGMTTQGDVEYHNGTNRSRLGAGTKGQALTTGGSGANPSHEGMTTQGDVEYHNGTNRSRLPAGTAGQALTTEGTGANPAFAGMTTEGDIEYHNGTTRTRLAKGTACQELKMNLGATAPEWVTGFLAANMLPNAGFGVWSVAPGASIGTAVAVSAYTLGANTVVCTTTNTQNLKIGKMITVTVGNASLTVCFHTITALTINTSFQFNLEGNSVAAGDGGAITVYEAVPYSNPGYATDYACDGDRINYWKKSTTITQYREHIEDLPGPASFYMMKVVKGSDTGETVHFSWDKATYPAEVIKFADKKMVFGAWVYPLTSNNVRLSLADGVSTELTAYAPINTWTWLETTITVGSFADIDQLTAYFMFDKDSTDVAYIACPMLSFGSCLGEGNYAPILNEVVHCVGHISPAHWTGATVTGSKIFRLEGETNGQIPKGAKALSLAFEGICNTAGDTLCVFRNAVADPLSHGIILGCPVANKASYGGTSLVQIYPGLENYIYITKNGSGTWTLVSFDINEVWY